MAIFSPRRKCRKSNPGHSLAKPEDGSVASSQYLHTSGLSFGLIAKSRICRDRPHSDAATRPSQRFVNTYCTHLALRKARIPISFFPINSASTYIIEPQ